MTKSTSSSQNMNLSNSKINDKKDIFEFWLQPENYKHVPVKIALELFYSNQIKIRELAWYFYSDSKIPHNFEKICKELVEQHFPKLVNQKKKMLNYNWFAFFEYCVYVQDDDDFIQQEEEHERKLKLYESHLTAMEMVSGGTELVQNVIENKRKLMMTSPKKALKIMEPADWIAYKKFEESDKSKYQNEYIKQYSLNEDPIEAHFLAYEEVLKGLSMEQRPVLIEKENKKCLESIPKISKAKTVKKSEPEVDLSFLKPYLSNDAFKRVEKNAGQSSSKKGKVKKQEHKIEVKENENEGVSTFTFRDLLKKSKESKRSSVEIWKENKENPSKTEFDSNYLKENMEHGEEMMKTNSKIGKSKKESTARKSNEQVKVITIF